MLITGSWDSTVRVWPLLPSGLAPMPLRTLGEHDTRVLCAALCPTDLRLAASGSASGDVALWDARKPGAAALLLEPHAGRGETTGVSIGSGMGSSGSSGGTGYAIVSCASDGSVAVSELRSARPRLLRSNGPPQSCVRSFDGGCLTAGVDGVVNVWDSTSLYTRHTADLHAFEGQPGGTGGSAGGGIGTAPAAADSPSAIRSMHLWTGAAADPAGTAPVRLVTGHENGLLCWWTSGT